MALLEVENLSISFGGLLAVSDVSFKVEEGDRLAIIGPNGAGKTTLFNMLTGQLRPVSGKVYFQGRDVTNMSVHGRAHLGMARSFQIASLFLNESVFVNILIAVQGMKRRRYGLWQPISRDKVLTTESEQLLDSMGLWEKRNEIVNSLAYGDQRKLEIALSLASCPKLLLLDEPSCGLTATESAEITARIRDLGSKVTVLMIAHDMDLVFGVAERIILLHYGVLTCDGTPDEMRKNQQVKDIYMGARKGQSLARSVGHD